MLVDDEMYLKPNCGPVCDHSEVCFKCGRPHCIKSMMHSRLNGYTCICGSFDYKKVIEYPDPEKTLREMNANLAKGKLVRMVNSLANIVIEAAGKNGSISSNDVDFANDCLDRIAPFLKYLSS